MPDFDTIPSPLPNAGAGTALALRQPYMLQTGLERALEDESDENALTLADLLHIVMKHKWTLLLVMMLSLGVAAVHTFLLRPTYRATVVLQIDKPPARIVEFSSSTGGSLDQDPFVADESMSLRTQYELLRSRSLAERVIDELQLDQSKSSVTLPAKPAPKAEAERRPAAPAATGLWGRYVDQIISGYRKLSSPATKDTEVLGREGVVGAFLGALFVEPIQNSRLVKLSVDNVDPELAARVANTTAQTYISLGQERRLESSSYAKNFLEDQIKQIKAKLEESERKLSQYAKDKQILTLDEKTDVVNQTYMEYAAALSKAEQDRIKAESLYSEVKRNPGSAHLALESKTVQNYKDEKSKLELEYQQNLRIYKPDFPKMQQIKAQISEVDSQLNAEIATVVTAVQAQYEAAVRQEAMLREKLGQTRKQVVTTQDSSIDLNLLKREVDTNRQLYDGLLQRLKQVGVSSGVSTNNISVVDSARPPLFPYKPNLQSNLLAGLAVGLFLGLCLVFLLEYLDDSIKFADEVERVLGVALMGIIPLVKRKRGDEGAIALEVHTDLRSMLAEAYRSLRTALQFSTSQGAPKRLLITSTTRDEGKSTTALALAINFAQMGQQVLLVDADMRNPSLHNLLGITNDAGLSNFLSTERRAEALIRPTAVPNLSVLTAGPPPPNPVDLLTGPKLMSLLDKSSEFGIGHVIIDGPPVLGIADSIVLGNQLQEILFIVRAGTTRKASIRDALRRLRLAGLTPRGVVLTQVPHRSMPQDYRSYYGYPVGQHDGGAALSKQAA
jgi:polysaccharide biosynthesis transport protein